MNRWGPPPAGSPPGTAVHEEFDNLAVAISGTGYTLTGTLDGLYWNSGKSYTGEVRITSHGTLVALIYGDGSAWLRTYVLSPLAAF